MIEQVITYGSQNISYQVSFSQRKTLDISVHPDQKITVKAPTGTPLEAIAKRVKHRAHWIIKQQQYFSQFTPRTPSRRYVGGETHLYLGRQYRLKIEAAIDTQVKLKGGYILIQTPQINGSETINQDLIRASTNCIDYVIIHELCHLKYQDHSPHFYEFLTLMMPDWEIRKHKLETLLS
ncbi:M48 family metallopeptidase [Cyanothece sp. BG0011]|uniref:M48 family metallopeptidase n=1 Tax=Cyanothece sp. BG0011 TaxID=2082950 RepID=UPI000D1F95A4|nr:YgjP-like metallopeptidase domain-containing protein [Cyanothece sp. BG0011]